MLSDTVLLFIFAVFTRVYACANKHTYYYGYYFNKYIILISTLIYKRMLILRVRS